MTEQQFRDKYADKSVHCDTEEKAEELLKMAHGFGWKWASGRNLSKITYWQELEEETCYHFDSNKTVGYARLDYYKSEGYEIVEFEREEKELKTKITKKVFSLWLFIAERIKSNIEDENILDSIKIWALEAHGLTKEEMLEKGWSFYDDWLKEVEVEVDVKLTTYEAEVLKALKLLDFDWIVRDEDGALCAHKYKPSKRYNYWYSGSLDLRLNDDLITFITWQDDEPTSIEELLNYAENTKGE